MPESPSSPSPEGMAQETPWSMEKDVVDVLLEGVLPAKEMNLYGFLMPVSPHLTEFHTHFTLRDFVRTPRRFIEEEDWCDLIWQNLPRLVWKFKECVRPRLRHYGHPDGWKAAQWECWEILIHLDHPPLDVVGHQKYSTNRYRGTFFLYRPRRPSSTCRTP
ncbi:VSG-associated, congolense-specific ORF [Trypanosoma congolense IL3000]|uniref:VSG-associated, congolense-specific ORF n=1 Tax=Trypanosoma congolense (strain IL3000) TaxID=1068625 RepID=F9WIG7_TRYCI|nr:VSG-associated, congolense-specific ORF [Trypanosoma congolense IL3000]